MTTRMTRSDFDSSFSPPSSSGNNFKDEPTSFGYKHGSLRVSCKTQAGQVDWLLESKYTAFRIYGTRSCPPKIHHISRKTIYQKCHLGLKSDEADILKALCLTGWLHCDPDVHCQLSGPHQMTNQDSCDKSHHEIWVFLTKKLWENKPYIRNYS